MDSPDAHAHHDHAAMAASAEPQPGFWSNLFSADFMPHGHCYLWRPEIVWTNVISDCAIAFAYYSIPVILFLFVSRRRDVPFNWMFMLFGVFILACGTTHVIEVITVWEPMYRLGAVVKVITAVVSIAAAVGLVPIIPKALALPSLRQANQRLEVALGEVKRSNAELEQFAYVSSHDLQEPIRMVTMYLQLIERRVGPKLEADEQGYLRYAIEGSDRMRGLVHDLLRFARIERDREAAGDIDADAALRAALDNLKPAIERTRTDVTCAAMPRVHANLGQLTQVFQNLVGNAIKYGSTEKPWVHVTARRDGALWEFAVRDNGIGIEPTHHARIFEVFQRLHGRDRYEGTGIGLSICKKIIEQHGGTIRVESTLGSGATFFFTIPAAPSEPPA